jgi:hypothetical protein
VNSFNDPTDIIGAFPTDPFDDFLVDFTDAVPIGQTDVVTTFLSDLFDDFPSNRADVVDSFATDLVRDFCVARSLCRRSSTDPVSVGSADHAVVMDPHFRSAKPRVASAADQEFESGRSPGGRSFVTF